jgi:hypothetical protein
MAITLVVEDGTGKADANAFASRAAVTARLALTPFAAAWGDVAVERQDQCIAEATAWISHLSWIGVATTATQALAWPRAWMQTPDGYAIASNSIPLWLVDATARLAFWLSQQATTPFADSGLQPGTRLTLPGGLSFTIAGGIAMPPDVRDRLRPYVRSSRSLVRG